MNQLSLFEEQANLEVNAPQVETKEDFKVSSYRLQRVKTEEHHILDIHEPIRSPGDAAGSMRHIFKTDELHKEHLFMISLNTKNKIVAAAVVHIGSLNAAIIHPRDVFQHAILDNAASIMIGHNHPSGDTSPSREDKEVTKRMVEAGKLLGIDVLDHIILGEGRGNYMSFREKGYM